MTERAAGYTVVMPALNRRDFLQLSGLTGVMAGLAACTPLSLAESFQKSRSAPFQWARPDGEVDPTWTALRRITFGPLPEELAQARVVGLETYIDEQLSPDTIPDGPLDARLHELTSLRMTPAQLYNVEPRSQPVSELVWAAALRAVLSRRQLFELVVDFWTNHFNIYIRKGAVLFLKIIDDREVIRKHALGRFVDLLKASARSPAMLLYLDNAQSTQDRPNENYARELLELHTLGVDAGYTQRDVENVARAFTGWSVAGPRTLEPGTFFFNARAHDLAPKQILDLHLPAGQGVEDGEQLLELLAAHPATARHVSTKLVRRFVSDDPPSELVDRAAATFLETGGEIRQVLRTILFSPEFQLSSGQKVKRPFEYMASALRLTGSSIGRDRQLGGFLAQMGQPLFQWPPPNGFPDVASAWISTSGMMARWNFALALSFGGFRDTRVDWARLVEGAGSPDEVLAQLSARLLPVPLPPEAKNLILAYTREFPADSQFVCQATGALILASPFFQVR